MVHYFCAPTHVAAYIFRCARELWVLRRRGYYVQITEVVGGSVMVQNCSAEIAFCETVHDLHFYLPLEAIF